MKTVEVKVTDPKLLEEVDSLKEKVRTAETIWNDLEIQNTSLRKQLSTAQQQFQALQREIDEQTSIQHLASAEVEPTPSEPEDAETAEVSSTPASVIPLSLIPVDEDAPVSASERLSPLTRSDSTNSIEVGLSIHLGLFTFIYMNG